MSKEEPGAMGRRILARLEEALLETVDAIVTRYTNTTGAARSLETLRRFLVGKNHKKIIGLACKRLVSTDSQALLADYTQLLVSRGL